MAYKVNYLRSSDVVDHVSVKSRISDRPPPVCSSRDLNPVDSVKAKAGGREGRKEGEWIEVFWLRTKPVIALCTIFCVLYSVRAHSVHFGALFSA